MTRLDLQSPDQWGEHEGSTRLNAPITLQRGPQISKNRLKDHAGFPRNEFGEKVLNKKCDKASSNSILTATGAK
jgi:hypothetical protein